MRHPSRAWARALSWVVAAVVGALIAPSASTAATTLDVTGCLGPGSLDLGVMLSGTPAVTGDDCTIVFGSDGGAAELRLYQQDGAGPAMDAIADRGVGGADWAGTGGAGMFGVCLRERNAQSATGVGWTVDGDGDCNATDLDPWVAVAEGSPDPTALVASALAPGVEDAEVSLRFGAITSMTTPAGTRVAALSWEVLDPGVPNLPPSAAALVAPDAGASTLVAPTLSATFADPDAADTGAVEFQVTSDAACTVVVGSGSSATGLANGANGTWTPAALTPGTTYHWCARNRDQADARSGWSAPRSFTVNSVTPPTLGTPADAAVTTTTAPTLTASFADPDAGQTGTINFRVASDAACTTVEQAGSSPAGIAIGANGSWTPAPLTPGTPYWWCATSTDSMGVTSGWSAPRSLTVNGVTAPMLGTPADAEIVDSTPTLTATFADPNTGQTGTIHFRIASDAGCVTAVRNGSSSAGIAIGANGSWTPAPLTPGTPYWWCATSTDSMGATSGWSAPRSFTVNSVSAPVPVTPGAGAVTSATPTLTATFADPNAGQTGTIEFRVTSDPGCTTVLTSGSVGGIAIGANGSWTSGAVSGSRYWCARSIDSLGDASAWSTPRAFTVLPWWDATWAYRRQVTVSTTTAAPSLYSVDVQLDHAALVSAGKARADGNDLRVVHWNGTTWTELDRVLPDTGSTWNSTTTTIWFRTVAAIGGASSDSAYYLYYGKPTATAPPANKSNVYRFYDDFETGGLSKWTVRVGASSYWTANTAERFQGTYSMRVGSDSTLNRFITANSVTETDLVFDARWRTNGGGIDMLQAFRSPADSSMTGYEADLESDNDFVISKHIGGVWTSLASGGPTFTANVWHRVTTQITGTNMRLLLDDTQIIPASGWTNVGNQLSSGTIAFRAWNLPSGRNVWIDNVMARRFVDPEPTTAAGAELVP